MIEKTVFEKMLSKEIPVSAVYEDEEVLVINDIKPQAPVHLLIIPKKRAVNLNNLEDWSNEEAGRYLKAIAKVAKELNIENYKIEINNGDEAGQTVFYLHSHLLANK
jgi:histidine triad (HIT) family protein